MFKNISNHDDINDYFPIFIATVIIYIIEIIIIYLLNHENKNKKFDISVIISDILLVVTSIIKARVVYTYFFKEYNLLYFLLTSVGIQIFIDVVLYNLLFIDILENKENKVILPDIVRSIIINVSTILSASFLAGLNLNSKITLFISLLNLIFLIK